MYEYFQRIKTLPFYTKLFLLTEIPFGFAIGIWNVCLNFHLKQIGLDDVGIGSLTAFGMIVIACVSILAGFLNSRLGYRMVMAAGCVLLGAGFLVISLDAGVISAIPGQFLYSSGLACLLATEFPFLTATVENNQKQIVYSLLISIYFFAMIFGNNFVGAFSSFAGRFHDPYGTELRIGGFFLLGMAAGRSFLPDIRAAQKRERNFMKVILRPQVLSYLLFGDVSMTLFNSVMSMMNIILRNRFSIPDNIVGVIFSVTSVAGGIAAFVSPLISGRYRSDRKSVAVLIVQALAVILMSVPVPGLFVVMLTVRSMTCNMSYSMVDSAMLQSIRKEEQAAYSGARLCSNYIGMGIGSGLAGLLLSGGNYGPLMLISGCFAGTEVLIYTFICRRFMHPAD